MIRHIKSKTRTWKPAQAGSGRNMRQPWAQAGFTLVELTIAIAFISFILIFIMLTITQVMASYNKGATVKEINQLARSAADVMTRDIRRANIGSVNSSALAKHRVCLGDISYVWNLKDDDTNLYDNDKPVRFARVRNPGGSMCVPQADGSYPKVPAVLTAGVGAGSDLIPTWDDVRVWVYAIDIQVDTALELVTVKVVLSTTFDNQPVDDPVNGPQCSGDRNGSYCAVGTFETTVTTREGGE